MSNETVRIGELRISIPNIGKDEARALGGEIAQQVATTISTNMIPKQFGALNIKVKDSHVQQLPYLISEAIVKAMI